MEVRRMSKKIIGIIWMICLLVMTGCSNNPSKLILTQVYDNDTLQTQAYYELEHEKLTIEKEYTLSRTLQEKPTDLEMVENKETVQHYLANEFPNQEVSDDLFQTFTREINYVKVKSNKKGFELKGKDYQKRFTYIEGTKKRVADEEGIEYSIERE